MEAWREELYHYGIKGQKWGVRNGPPYPLPGGAYSKLERKHLNSHGKYRRFSIAAKKHADSQILKGEKITTLSYDKNRTKGADMFYGVHTNPDRHLYNALFNKAVDQPIYDEHGASLGTGKFLKYRINNAVKQNIKIASEDSASDVFFKLYSKNRDFYNYVVDPERMQHNFVDEKYKFKGYREAAAVLDKIRKGDTPTSQDLQVAYRMFNYTIPSEGADSAKQRARFFTELQKLGYSGVLDTNDAIYGGFKAQEPVIIFDMTKLVSSDVKRTRISEKRFSTLVTIGRKTLGL